MQKEAKILIVDDEPMFSEFLKELFETRAISVNVRVSPDGFDAGMQLRKFMPDFVLLDVHMPGFDGFRVCKQIKQDNLFSHIRVFTMTGNKTEQVENMLLAAGAEACFEKPINIPELFEAMELEALS